MAKQNGKKPYNPLDKINLGKSVANALLSSPLQKMPSLTFTGAGIYAIYYFGDNPLYTYVSQLNNDPSHDGEWPIYIGKAGGSGSRKGMIDVESTGTALFKRLKKHALSIDSAADLELSDFKCRYLTIDPIWIPLGEQLLIRKFKLLWNNFMDGFGNNDPGGRRKTQYTSPWDLMHPGRNYANRDAGNEKIADLDEYKESVLSAQLAIYHELKASDTDKL